jgi:putative membrane protein
MEFLPGSLNYWVLQTIAMLITALLLPGLTVKGPFGALLMVVSIAYLNAKAWDAALFFQVPDSLTIHTLVLVGANGILFWVLVKVLPGIEIEGFLPALFAPIVFTVTSILVSYYLKDVDWLKVLAAGLEYLRMFRDYLATLAASNSVTPVAPVLPAR